MKPKTKGIKFETDVKNSLVDVADQMGSALSAFLLPDSGKVAAKKKMPIGDIVVCRGYQVYFIDCTSVYERSDSPGTWRLTTAKKKMKPLFDYATAVNGSLPDKLLSYLDSTFDYPIHIEPEQIYDRGMVYSAGPVDVVNGPWHSGGNAAFVFAFKYEDEIYFMPLNKFTFLMLDKSDPNVEPLLKYSFNLPGFVDYVLTGSVASVGATHGLDCYIEPVDDINEYNEVPGRAVDALCREVFGTINITKFTMIMGHKINRSWSCRKHGFDCGYVHDPIRGGTELMKHIRDYHPDLFLALVNDFFKTNLSLEDVYE